MQVQEKKIKGFTLLELIVVIVILAVTSAVAYPNYLSWAKDREMRQTATRIKNFITTVNTQVQRGAYELIQVKIIEDGAGEVKFVSSGIGTTSLAIKKKNKTSRFHDVTKRCTISSDYWDDVGSDLDKASPGGVGEFSTDNIAINFTSDTFAVCFSKDGSYYSGNIDSPLNICLRRDDVPECSVDLSGKPNDSIIASGIGKYIYRVNWSRFGNVWLDKWNMKKDDWITE